MSEPPETPVIPCEEVITFLWAYLAGELPPARVAEFERHLAVCPSCVNYIHTYQKTIELSRGSYEPGSCEPGIEEMPEELVRAVMAMRRGE
ncbi:MAG TPA: zf-HC2 domain-containing protein [Thermoanaerobaculia bacterium]|jgi:anti-sigma factor RsiW